MRALQPRIYGWRLTGGVVLWVTAVLGTVAQVLGEIAGAGEGGWIEALAVPVALLVLSAAFWRGYTLARWLALIPAGLLLAAAAFTAGLVGVCSGGDGGSGFCFPGPSMDQMARIWPVTVALVAAGLVVVIGVLRPGVRQPL